MSSIDQMIEKIRDDDKFQELFQHLSEKLNYKEGLDELLLTVIREFLGGPEMESLLLQQATISNVTQLWIVFYERLLHSDIAFHIGSCAFEDVFLETEEKYLVEAVFRVAVFTWERALRDNGVFPGVLFSAEFEKTFFKEYQLTVAQAHEKTVGELIEYAPVPVLLGFVLGRYRLV